MKKFNMVYYTKRLGFSGVLKRVLNKLGIIDFNIYEHIYNRYYSKLKPEDYENELVDWYKYISGEDKNPLVNPKTFNEKVQWLKIHDSTKLKTLCADKYKVRDYIKENIGEEYLVPLCGCWDKFEDIDFSNLPDKMIFKSTTGSGRYEIIKSKEDIDYKKLKKSMDSWQRLPFGYAGMELHYLDIERKIICEKLLDMQGPSVIDYKIHCFNGVPYIFEYISDRSKEFYLESWFDTDWNRLRITMNAKSSLNHKEIPAPPKNLKKMFEIAKALSKEFIYVRVDLYEIEGKVYFGELTFTPANGMDEWKEEESQVLVGQLLRLPYEDKLSEDEINEIMDKLRY
ncbi:MAG: ATP-grasp fold amidoligase family protein [Tissierellia bacterium]|nr:ATP-grasp fold amidoligase family protein [Tissierellia bacterium]